MADGSFEGIVELYEHTSRQFGLRVAAVPVDGWDRPSTCSEWTVRALVNHVTRGNLNYIGLTEGATAAEFLRLRDADALGADPQLAYREAWQGCAAAFARPGVLDRIVDYPLGRIPARQALAVRTADTVVHTWDLAHSVGADETLDPKLVDWVLDGLGDIYAGLAEGPADPASRFFGRPLAVPPAASRQDRLLRLMGRN